MEIYILHQYKFISITEYKKTSKDINLNLHKGGIKKGLFTLTRIFLIQYFPS